MAMSSPTFITNGQCNAISTILRNIGIVQLTKLSRYLNIDKNDMNDHYNSGEISIVFTAGDSMIIVILYNDHCNPIQ